MEQKAGAQISQRAFIQSLVILFVLMIIGDKKVICALSSENPKDLIFIKELVEAGKIKSIIDRCNSLEQAAETHRYIEQGHKKADVLITMEDRH
jgi:hypothetical protein